MSRKLRRSRRSRKLGSLRGGKSFRGGKSVRGGKLVRGGKTKRHSRKSRMRRKISGPSGGFLLYPGDEDYIQAFRKIKSPLGTPEEKELVKMVPSELSKGDGTKYYNQLSRLGKALVTDYANAYYGPSVLRKSAEEKLQKARSGLSNAYNEARGNFNVAYNRVATIPSNVVSAVKERTNKFTSNIQKQRLENGRKSFCVDSPEAALKKMSPFYIGGQLTPEQEMLYNDIKEYVKSAPFCTAPADIDQGEVFSEDVTEPLLSRDGEDSRL